MKKKMFYGFGGLCYSVISQTVSTFFMFYATSVLGISGTLVGVAIAIGTIWDGVSDTFVGFFSDNYPIGKMGRRNGYMLIAVIGMSIFNLALWCVPIELGDVIKFVWILISLILLETFNTMFATPYYALGNEISNNYNDRTKVNAFSTVFYLIGIIIPSILMLVFLPSTKEYPIGQLNPKGYFSIAIVTSIICFVFGMLCVFFARKKEKIFKKSKRFRFRDLIGNFLMSFKDKSINKIIWGYVFTSIATVFLCSVGLHFFTYSFFYNSTQITVLLLILILGTIVSQPLWIIVSKKINKKPALVVGILLTIISVFAVITIYLFRIEIYKISYYLMVLAIFVCGVGSGAMYSLPNSIYGDAVEKKCKEGGNEMMATYSGTMTFAGNIANSITQLLVGVMLDIIKFDNSSRVQTLGVQTGLALILFVGVQISLISGCLCFLKYKENKRK